MARMGPYGYPFCSMALCPLKWVPKKMGFSEEKIANFKKGTLNEILLKSSILLLKIQKSEAVLSSSENSENLTF